VQLLPPEPAAREDARRVFRTSRVAAGVMLVVYAAFSALALRLLLAGAPHVPAIGWLFAIPVLAVGGLLAIVVLWTLCSAFFAGFRASNWILQITGDGVLLNLRSYLNAHLEGTVPTVVSLGFAEIASAVRVRERRERPSDHERSVEIRSWLELRLRGVDTRAIEEAVRAERARPAPTRVFLGIRSRSRSPDVTVFVPSPGVVRVAWRRGMLEALANLVPTEPTREVDLDAAMAGRSTDDRCLARLERGDRMDAIETARAELDLDLTEAVRRVDALERRSA
jgi:hypothetical protein